MPKLEPKIYSTKDKEVLGLLDYPMDNVVATNRLGNAVTMIKFSDDKAKFKTVAKNFKDYVGGGHTVYLPALWRDTIGYSQNRGFTLLNLKNKKCKYYSIAGSSNLLITSINVISPEKYIFLFGVDYIATKDPLQILRIMDLSEREGQIIKEKMIDGKWMISAIKGNIFLYNKNVIKIVDSKLEEVLHPLSQIKQSHKIAGSIIDLSIHPRFPMAIIHDQNNATHQCNIWVANWRDSNKNEETLSMIKLIENCDSFNFTDDGKWVVFRDFDFYYMMPIDSELPYFVGDPILLGEAPSFPDNVTAMTRNPTGFVVAKLARKKGKNVSSLLKWDFTEAEKFLKK